MERYRPEEKAEGSEQIINTFKFKSTAKKGIIFNYHSLQLVRVAEMQRRTLIFLALHLGKEQCLPKG